MNKRNETALYNPIRAGVPDFCRLFRNNVAKAFQGIKRRVKLDGQYKQILTEIRKIDCGLCICSSDLIGYTSIEITPEMVGKKIAVFTATEVKDGNNVADENQENFIEEVKRYGGIAGVVYSVDDAVKLIDGFIEELKK